MICMNNSHLLRHFIFKFRWIIGKIADGRSVSFHHWDALWRQLSAFIPWNPSWIALPSVAAHIQRLWWRGLSLTGECWMQFAYSGRDVRVCSNCPNSSAPSECWWLAWVLWVSLATQVQKPSTASPVVIQGF